MTTPAYWSPSKITCEGFGYHLVAISSYEENLFVTTLVKAVFPGKLTLNVISHEATHRLHLVYEVYNA